MGYEILDLRRVFNMKENKESILQLEAMSKTVLHDPDCFHDST